MKWFNSLKVGTKLIGGFLMVAVVAAVIGLLGLRSVTELSRLLTTMYSRDIIGLQLASSANLELMAAERAIRNAMLVRTVEELDTRTAHLEATQLFIGQAKTDIEQLAPSFTTAEDQLLLEEARNTLIVYEAAVQTIAEMIESELIGNANPDSHRFMAAELQPIADQLETLSNALIVRKLDAAHALDVYANEVNDRVFIFMGALSALGAVIAILIGLFMTRGLTRQLGGEPLEVVEIAYSIAKGNLNTKIDIDRAPQGSVMDAMYQMQVSLRQVVAGVRASSTRIAMSSGQIALGNQHLSQRTEAQTASIAETVAAMNELSNTVQTNSELAHQAVQTSSRASAAAARGGAMVNNVVATMNEVNDASHRIVEIIDVINSIAFQTNILALNAAVEAARAGEQGRGFAVVASEVRSLAQRSASAADDIKHLIDDSVGKVETGTQLVGEAGAAMHDIVSQIQHVTELINDISAATTEQTTGLAQINTAVMELRQVTDHNAVLAEESTTASSSLSHQADHLVEVVSVFQLDGENAVQSSNKAVRVDRSTGVPLVSMCPV